MAIPIKATPSLEGEDAENFYNEIEGNENKKLPESMFKSSFNAYEDIVKKNPNIKLFSSWTK